MGGRDFGGTMLRLRMEGGTGRDRENELGGNDEEIGGEAKTRPMTELPNTAYNPQQWRI